MSASPLYLLRMPRNNFTNKRFADYSNFRKSIGLIGASTGSVSVGDHTETVALEFDPERVSYEELLDKFWRSHNPCSQRNNQYMSAIFYHGTKEKLLAEKTRDEVQKHTIQPIVTKILPAETFYTAENYHQKYILRQHHELLDSLNLTDEEIITSPVACKLNGYLAGHGVLEDVVKDCRDFGLTEKQTSYVRKEFTKKQSH